MTTIVVKVENYHRHISISIIQIKAKIQLNWKPIQFFLNRYLKRLKGLNKFTLSISLFIINKNSKSMGKVVKNSEANNNNNYSLISNALKRKAVI